MTVKRLALAGALLATFAAAGLARADQAPRAAAVEEVQAKIPPPRPQTSCYYRRQCADSPRYGRICWRVDCAPNNNLIRR